MSRGYPSMTALLALLAMAGYQNRDKIAEWLKTAQSKMNSPTPGSGAGAGGSFRATSVDCWPERALETCWAMACATWSTASKRPVTARRLIPGSATDRTSRSLPPISKRLSGQKYWPHCRKRRGSRGKRSLRGSRKLFPRLSTNTPRTGEFLLQARLLRQRVF
jgi:hypothetical protein